MIKAQSKQLLTLLWVGSCSIYLIPSFVTVMLAQNE